MFIVIFAFACKNKNTKPDVKKPDSLIGKQKMAQVICDLNKAESIIKLKLNRTDSLNMYPDSVYSSVMEKYKVNKKQIEQSLRWYAQDPKTLEDIFNNSITLLTQQESKTERRKNNAKKR